MCPPSGVRKVLSKGSPVSVSRVVHVEHPTSPVSVWCDSTDEPMIGIEVGFPGKVGDDPQYIPVEVARQVAAAILESIPD